MPTGIDHRAASSGPRAPGGWWYGIGKSPTARDIELAAKRYDVVVLNAWEQASLRRLRELNPAVKVLVYKDLSSTRSYAGAVDGGKDARFLPAGIGFVAARPEWFALDSLGRRIEWTGYPKHWQMAVWDAGYQQAWISAVLDEVTREGWDGVLADNDMYSLTWYSKRLLNGTSSQEGTDKLLRDGYDEFLGCIRPAFAAAGKLLVPNISESHVQGGRWTAHSRTGGGMEENFALRQDSGVLTFAGREFAELRAQAAAGTSWLLLLSRVRSNRDELTGYATAALLAGPKTCWSGATTPDYQVPDWSPLQARDLGAATTDAVRTRGVWTRAFTGGWVAVNPTSTPIRVTPPPGLVRLDGQLAVAGSLDAADALVLFAKPT
jgi:endo-alpha-1,4-polygalactosaminidase (GH114 family)